jgi:hypothetical protein
MRFRAQFERNSRKIFRTKVVGKMKKTFYSVHFFRKSLRFLAYLTKGISVLCHLENRWTDFDQILCYKFLLVRLARFTLVIRRQHQTSHELKI